MKPSGKAKKKHAWKIKERGGKNTIAKMLGRGCSFEEIDAARKIIEAADRAEDRKRWERDVPAWKNADTTLTFDEWRSCRYMGIHGG